MRFLERRGCEETQMAKRGLEKIKAALNRAAPVSGVEEHKLSDAPCNKCGYNGAGYYQEGWKA